MSADFIGEGSQALTGVEVLVVAVVSLDGCLGGCLHQPVCTGEPDLNNISDFDANRETSRLPTGTATRPHL